MSQMRQNELRAKVNVCVVEMESDDPREERYKEIQGVWAMSVCTSSNYQTVS